MNTGRVVLITAASGGVGSALVEHFLNNGDQVVATAMDPDALNALRGTQDGLGAGGNRRRRLTPPAVRFDRYGDVDVLYVAEVEVVDPSPGTVVVVRVHAGVNFGENAVRSGAMDKIAPAHFPEGQGNAGPALALAVDAGRVDTIIDFPAGQRLGIKTDGRCQLDDIRSAVVEPADLAAHGQLVILIKARFPLPDVQDAYRLFGERSGRPRTDGPSRIPCQRHPRRADENPGQPAPQPYPLRLP